MKKFRNPQKGFSAIEVVIVAIIVGLIGFIGWSVYKKNREPLTQTPSSVNSSQQTSQSQGQIITTEDKKLQLTLPDSWHLVADSDTAVSGSQIIKVNTATHLCDKYNPSDCSAIAPCLDAEDTVACTYTAQFQPKALDPQKDNTWSMTVEKSDVTITQASKRILGSNEGIEKSDKKINGYDALYTKVDAGSGYTDIHYFIADNGYLVHFFNRVVEANPTPGSIHRDYSQYSSDFDAIVKSIKLSY